MTAPARIDLHTHSSVSDGTDTPAELVARAQAAGLDVVALSDHDTHGGIGEARAAAEQCGLALVPAIELSCEQDGRSVHVLGYGGDPRHPELVAELDRILRGRRDRVPTMVARLNDLGLDLDMDDVAAQAREATSIGRPHVADALVAAGHVPDRSAAFADYLAEGRPAYVGRYAPDVAEGIRLLRDAGAVPVVAHPWGRDSRGVLDAETLAGLFSRGLAGLEVDHVEHDAADRQALRRLGRAHDVLMTGSSDYHGAGKPGNPLGACTTEPRMYARLVEMMADD